MRILAVDDELHGLHDIKDCLAAVQPSAEVVCFLRSDEALQYARHNPIDVAFLDIKMPVIGGIELAKALKQIYPRVNIVFCTAFSEYAVDAVSLHASGYVCKPYKEAQIKNELDNLLYPQEVMPHIYARTFGDFDLFVDGAVVTFKRAKSKEMLAYLVYKNGGTVSRKELAAVLFGDDYSVQTQNYIAKIYGDLLKTLQTLGVADILQKGFNQYSVDVRQFQCDYYDYAAGKPHAINAYKGVFMAQYEWAEF